MDRLRAIKYFIEVATRENFTQTAKFFGVPASSVSRRIQELESHLGVSLIHRTTRSVSLTELGVLYLDHVRSALSALEYADEMVSTGSDKPAGTLTITAPPDYGRLCVIPALEKFRLRYPDIVLDIQLTDHVANLAENDVDLAIRATAQPPERSVARKLTDNDFALMASPAYIELYGAPTNLDELETHKALIYRRPDGLLHWQANTDQGWRELHPKLAYICNQGDALADQAVAGTGIALLPQWGVERFMDEGSLVAIEIEDAEVTISRNPNSGIYLLYHRPKYGLKKVQLAVEFLITELPTNTVRDS
jgi:DNA-binding transcriptional LysR family regulator